MKILIVLMLLAAVPVMAQQRRGGGGRGDQAPDQATTPARGARAGGGGGVPTAGEMDESAHVTHHEIQLHGKTLKYTATAQLMPIKSATGETEGHIFYVAYTLDDPPVKRPLTFAFNGGPGSASMWVHMGAMGPKRVKMMDDGDMPEPPFNLVDNAQTWLDKSDLVFIDAIGTGYSRATTTEIAQRFNGVQGDLQSIGEFIRMYISRNSRWTSPLFIAGESYGTFRAAGLAGYLIDQGIAFNGIVLISTVLNYEMTRPNLANGLVYALYLPTYTADAWYHKRVAPDLQKDLKSTLKEAEGWAMTGYIEALNKGDSLTPAERKTVIDKLVRYTGLDPHYLDDTEMRFGVNQFQRQLLHDQKLTIGRYDGRMTGPSPLNAGENAEFDPSGTLPLPPFQSTFLDYVHNELEFKTDMKYYVSGGIAPWDFGVQNGYAETGSALRNAFVKNPHMKVMVCAGYYDLATPFYSVEYTFTHMGLPAESHKNISFQYYESGHMMYLLRSAHAKLTKDFDDFVDTATAAEPARVMKP